MTSGININTLRFLSALASSPGTPAPPPNGPDVSTLSVFHNEGGVLVDVTSSSLSAVHMML
jgi:hypothetical protein